MSFGVETTQGLEIFVRRVDDVVGEYGRSLGPRVELTAGVDRPFHFQDTNEEETRRPVVDHPVSRPGRVVTPPTTTGDVETYQPLNPYTFL